MTPGTTASLITFVRDVASPWAYPIVFLSAAAEAALFVGIVFPGETLLLLAGFLAWKGDLDISIALAAAVLGAVIGDSLGYEVGRRFGPQVRDSRLGRRIPDDKWERSERYLRERGGKAVFLARFVTGPKAIVPALAGEARMPYVKFLAWNVSSAVVWGAFHVGIGYVAGPSWQTVDQYFQYGGYAVVGVIVVTAVTYVLVRRHRQPERRQAARSH